MTISKLSFDGRSLRVRGVWAVLLAVAMVWAYWPTWSALVHAWQTHPDYSHGFFVLPGAFALLWLRRDGFPGFAARLVWPGLVVIGLSVLVRWLGARFFLESADGWSLILWLTGLVWFIGGWAVVRWSAPALAFLFFMVPLPYRVETALSLPLQRVATKGSAWLLQLLGQPAIAEGNVILLDEQLLEVEQACAGLRTFTGIAALAFASIVMVRRPAWEKAGLLLSVAPVAVTANILRITATGFVYQYVSDAAGRQAFHDVAGWLMVLTSAALFALILWYSARLFPTLEQVDNRDLMRGWLEPGTASSN